MATLSNPASKLTALSILILFVACSKDTYDYKTNEVHLKKYVISWFSHDHDGSNEHTVVSTIPTDLDYDETGRLSRAAGIEFIYDGNNRLVMTIDTGNKIYYDWDGNKLSSIRTYGGYYDGGIFIDTTAFIYEGNQLSHAVSTYAKTHTEFIYHQDTLAAKYITRLVAGVSKCDSLIYSWKDGNLLSIETKSASPLNSEYYKREFRYDANPSWTLAATYPAEYLFIRELTQFYGKHPLFYYDVIPWRYNNKNNIVEFIEHTNNQTKITPIVIDYNYDGFPTSIHSERYMIELEYYFGDDHSTHHH